MTRLQRSGGVIVIVVAGLCVVAAAHGTAPRAAHQQTPPQTPTFRSGTSAVRVDAAVRDASRRVMEGLTAADFTVTDNGIEQRVEDVTFGKAPIDVTIGLDVSRSVAGPLLDRLRQGVTQLARDLRREDRLKLLVFNHQVSRLVDFTSDLNTIDRAMRAATASGGTALFDALSMAMMSTAPEIERRQLIMVFTDGQDGSSTTSAEALHAVAERTRATVSFVVLPAASTLALSETPVIRSLTSPLMPSFTLIHPAVQKLANDTGGQVLSATQGTVLGAVFLRALDAFRATYVLHYTPRGVSADGFHVLDVKVNRQGAVVQARRGYFGG